MLRLRFAHAALAAAVIAPSLAIAAQIDGPICHVTATAEVREPKTPDSEFVQLWGEDVRLIIAHPVIESCAGGAVVSDGRGCFPADGARYIAVLEAIGPCGDMKMIGVIGRNENADGTVDCAPGTGTNPETGACFRDASGECIPCKRICAGRLACSSTGLGVGGAVGQRQMVPTIECEMDLSSDAAGDRLRVSDRIRAGTILDYAASNAESLQEVQAACDAGQTFHLSLSGALVGGELVESDF